MTEPKNAPHTINVTSNHQSGGITAHTVNFNHTTPQRMLGDAGKKQLLDTIPRDKLLVVWATHGNTESYKYAEDIFRFMKSADYKMFGDGPANQLFVTPLYGASIELESDKTHIYVGLFEGNR